MSGRYWVYYGTSGAGQAQGMYCQWLDVDSLELGDLQRVADGEQMGFATVNAAATMMYAIETVDGSGWASAFRIDRATGALRRINQRASGGGKLTYIGLTHDESHVLTAGYGDAILSVFPVASDGALDACSYSAQLQGGSGVVADRQESAHAHSIYADPTDRCVLVCDLGNDMVRQYLLDRPSGALVPNRFAFTRTSPGAGPRHLAFHPNGRWVYVINELANTVTHFHWDAQLGTLIERASRPTLPGDFTGKNTTAEVIVSSDGRYLYGSNRGHESIVVYAIDHDTGGLTLVQHESTRGEHPRNFSIDPSGKVLVAANANTSNVTFYRIDRDTGRLTFAERDINVDKPICVRFVPAS